MKRHLWLPSFLIIGLVVTPAAFADADAEREALAKVIHELKAIASMILVLAFVWVIWVALGTFRAWQEGQATLFDLTWSTLRASIVLMVLGFYLR